MADISHAVPGDKGFVYVYGDNNQVLFAQHGKLLSCTGRTVTILDSSGWAYTYDANGSRVASNYVGN